MREETNRREEKLTERSWTDWRKSGADERERTDEENSEERMEMNMV